MLAAFLLSKPAPPKRFYIFAKTVVQARMHAEWAGIPLDRVKVIKHWTDFRGLSADVPIYWVGDRNLSRQEQQLLDEIRLRHRILEELPQWSSFESP